MLRIVGTILPLPYILNGIDRDSCTVTYIYIFYHFQHIVPVFIQYSIFIIPQFEVSSVIAYVYSIFPKGTFHPYRSQSYSLLNNIRTDFIL
jgi:hypothetical protein